MDRGDKGHGRRDHGRGVTEQEDEEVVGFVMGVRGTVGAPNSTMRDLSFTYPLDKRDFGGV